MTRRKATTSATKGLRHAANQQRCNAFLLAADGNLGGHALFGGVRHFHESGDFTAIKCFAVESELVGARGERDVGAVEGL